MAIPPLTAQCQYVSTKIVAIQPFAAITACVQCQTSVNAPLIIRACNVTSPYATPIMPRIFECVIIRMEHALLPTFAAVILITLALIVVFLFASPSLPTIQPFATTMDHAKGTILAHATWASWAMIARYPFATTRIAQIVLCALAMGFV